MTLPLADATAAAPFGTINELPPRQRLDSVLAQLPNPGGAISQGSSGGDAISQDALVAPVQRINETMRAFGLEFELSDMTERPVTRIVDRDSGEVIRQIPAEELLRVAERLEELKGNLVRTQA
ncbi:MULTISPECIES: flagellar protein FlaG [unclassified Halomonas]|uniref:flagellar protein FlaG n=1 Tax=unclassified Halomonas TaxID=2609666 RepID=UPI00288790BE|nr:MULTISPECIES: flagellar protein FlaG [unclassified Halomonas]MDT0500497.1 flagellar protein FlaG [Halomonas sp. PAR7]MDT0511607.1 flagellar protein FlaG [Halomonas sp. LES1]MDT0590105.1 flagellar protein FlaG [Halomonas sp. PAR8]